MRVGIASLNHESNTFASFPTTYSDFRFVRGQEIIEQYRSTFHEVGGFIAGAEEHGYEMVPLMGAVATPAGAVEAEAYEALMDELLGLINGAMPLDGLLLGLHGAFVAEGFPQGDGETTRRVRELVGPDFPVIVTHDYHGNVPPQLVEDATALIIYKTCPHIDQRERGLQAAELLTRTVRGEVQPVSSIAKPELVYNIAFHNTNMRPMKPVMDAAIELERQPGILATSIAAGYQYADVPWMGPCIVVVADGDQDMADREAQRLADMMWSSAGRTAAEDSGPGRGRGDGDRERREAGLDDGNGRQHRRRQRGGRHVRAGGTAAARGERLGYGALRSGGGGSVRGGGHRRTVDAAGGGKVDDEHGPTLTVEGTVRALHDGKFIETEVRHGGGRDWDQGLTAVLATSGGLLVLDSRRTPPMSFNQLRSVGIMPEQQEIFVAKGSVAPRAAYEPVSARIIEVDSGGATSISRPPEAFRLARRGLYEWTQGA